MKCAMICLTMALTLLALPCATFADDGTGQQNSAIPTDDSESILDQIADAVTDLLGLDDTDSEEPLENVHPPDWKVPDNGPDLDEDPWEHQK